MASTPITLFGLAYSSRLYLAVTGRAWENLREKLQRRSGTPVPDLSNEQDCLDVMDFLNQWRCRFSHDAKSRTQACASLREWNRQWGARMPSPNTSLTSLSSDELATVVEAFDALAERTACFVSRQGQTLRKSFGPTGTAKVLFVFRPHAFPPWDDPIREALNCDGSGSGYRCFLLHAKGQLEMLVKDASRHGVSEDQIAAYVKRAGIPLAKLIDEFYWMTLTQGCRIPTREDLQDWLRLLPG